MKNIKDFDDFEGQDGYLIVDGTDGNTPGGKKLLSEIASDLPPIPEPSNNKTIRSILSVHNTGSTILKSWEPVVEYLANARGGLTSSSGEGFITFSINTTGAVDGNVLTYDDTNKTVKWIAPQGGGGASNFEIVDFKTYWDENLRKTVYYDDGKNINELIAKIKNGKQLCARILNVDEETKSIIYSVDGTFPLTIFYLSDGEAPMLYFNHSCGTGGGEGIIYNGCSEEWEGEWNDWGKLINY